MNTVLHTFLTFAAVLLIPSAFKGTTGYKSGATIEFVKTILTLSVSEVKAESAVKKADFYSYILGI